MKPTQKEPFNAQMSNSAGMMATRIQYVTPTTTVPAGLQMKTKLWQAVFFLINASQNKFTRVEK
jgi:hypothetical protein